MSNTSLVSTNISSKLNSGSFKELASDLFPAIDCPFEPFGARVLVQIASPLAKSAGGIVFTQDTLDLQKWTQNLGKVIALGPVAYKDRETLEDWPEGPWCSVGDYIHAPLYGGHRLEAKNAEGKLCLFATIQDREIYQRIKEGFDPLSLKPWF